MTALDETYAVLGELPEWIEDGINGVHFFSAGAQNFHCLVDKTPNKLIIKEEKKKKKKNRTEKIIRWSTLENKIILKIISNPMIPQIVDMSEWLRRQT